MVHSPHSAPKTITLSELKRGDLLLYKMKVIPEFKFPLTKENASENFSILVNRIIIFSENSPTHCTHAALVYSLSTATKKATAIEAALPYVHERTQIFDEKHTIEVHRVEDGTDGAKVLEYLPSIKEITHENVPYALFEAAFAALSCIFRTYGMYDTKKRTALLILLQLLLLPICAELDKLLPFAKGKDRPWFCSQIAAYCYNKAATDTGNNAYKIDAPLIRKGNTNIQKDTLFAWLTEDAQTNTIITTQAVDVCDPPTVPDSLKELVQTASFDSPELIAAGINFFVQSQNDTSTKMPTKDAQKSPLYKAVLKTAKRASGKSKDEKTYIASLCRSFLYKLFTLTAQAPTPQGFSDFLIRLESTFVMPSDLEDSLSQIFALEE